MYARVVFASALVVLCFLLIDGAPRRGGGGGRGNEGGNRCKYRKGQWGECNAATSKRARTDTLITEQSTGSCNATRIFEKACKRRTCEYGQWNDYGPCENNRQTKTREIRHGTQEECGAKARKTKTCRSPNSPPRNGTGGQRGGNGGRRRGGNSEGATGDRQE